MQKKYSTIKYVRSKSFIGVLNVDGQLCFIIKRDGYIKLVIDKHTIYHLHGIGQELYISGGVPNRLTTVDIVNYLQGKADGILYGGSTEYLLHLTDGLWIYCPVTKVSHKLNVTLDDNITPVNMCRHNA